MFDNSPLWWNAFVIYTVDYPEMLRPVPPQWPAHSIKTNRSLDDVAPVLPQTEYSIERKPQHYERGKLVMRIRNPHAKIQDNPSVATGIYV
jgi:hypothetical protein